jgi:methylmalonyl-CoA mutase
MVFNQLSKEYGLDEVPYIFAETSLRNKAVSDNENNLIRSTLELASAMIGGADAVFTNNYLVDRSTKTLKRSPSNSRLFGLRKYHQCI